MRCRDCGYDVQEATGHDCTYTHEELIAAHEAAIEAEVDRMREERHV